MLKFSGPWLALASTEVRSSSGFCSPCGWELSLRRERVHRNGDRAWCSSPNDEYIQYVTIFAISWFQPEHWPIEHGALVQESIIAQCFQKIGWLSPLSQRTGLTQRLQFTQITGNYGNIKNHMFTGFSQPFQWLFTGFSRPFQWLFTGFSRPFHIYHNKY